MTLVNFPSATVAITSLGLTFADRVKVVIKLDERRTPYVEATITVPIPDSESVLTSIDPRDGLRVTITATNTWEATARPDETRSFDLYLHKSTVKHSEEVLELVAYSDEALLLDDGNVTATTDISSRAFDASLRALINDRLSGYGGAALQAGAADADLTLTAAATNLVRNPRGITGTAGNPTDWGSTPTTGTRTITQPTVGGPTTDCPSFVRATVGTTLGSGYIVYISESTIPMTDQKYTVSAWVRCSSAINVAIGITTSPVGVSLNGGNVALPANTWKRVSYTLAITPGAGATNLRPIVYMQSALAAGGTFDVTGWRVSATSGIHDDDYFDGAKTANTYYSNFAWTGTAHLSTSTRTPDPARPDNQMLDQRPGITDWDFLHVLVAAAGLRLFCDEQRKWRLVDNAYSVAGTLTLDPDVDLERADDTISLEDDYFAAVVIRYFWTDGAGGTHERFDVAGTAGPILNEEIEARWPGAGAAAARRTRTLLRGRSVPVDALLNLNATPCMAIALNGLPSTPDLVGVTSSVTFTIDDGDGDLNVGTRAVVEA